MPVLDRRALPIVALGPAFLWGALVATKIVDYPDWRWPGLSGLGLTLVLLLRAPPSMRSTYALVGAAWIVALAPTLVVQHYPPWGWFLIEYADIILQNFWTSSAIGTAACIALAWGWRLERIQQRQRVLLAATAWVGSRVLAGCLEQIACRTSPPLSPDGVAVVLLGIDALGAASIVALLSGALRSPTEVADGSRWTWIPSLCVLALGLSSPWTGEPRPVTGYAIGRYVLAGEISPWLEDRQRLAQVPDTALLVASSGRRLAIERGTSRWLAESEVWSPPASNQAPFIVLDRRVTARQMARLMASIDTGASLATVRVRRGANILDARSPRAAISRIGVRMLGLYASSQTELSQTGLVELHALSPEQPIERSVRAAGGLFVLTPPRSPTSPHRVYPERHMGLPGLPPWPPLAILLGAGLWAWLRRPGARTRSSVRWVVPLTLSAASALAGTITAWLLAARDLSG